MPLLETKAEIIEAPTSLKTSEPIRVVAKTDRFLECTLVMQPANAVVLMPPKLNADENGDVQWEVKINPGFSGSLIEWEFRARTNRFYRAKTIKGSIAIHKQFDEGQNSGNN